MISEDKYNKDSIEDLRKDLPDGSENLDNAWSNYISEKDLKILKSEFADKWNCIGERVAYLY